MTVPYPPHLSHFQTLPDACFSDVFMMAECKRKEGEKPVLIQGLLQSVWTTERGRLLFRSRNNSLLPHNVSDVVCREQRRSWTLTE